nr:serine hydrolase domain-containing protein [uncultured Undibacterium sp.]
MKKILLATTVFVLVPLVYVSVPIYQGLAHRGILPMVGWDYQTWPTEQPTSQQVNDNRFKTSGLQALNLLKKQQKVVSAPGYTAAVAINGNIVWAGSVGWADIARQIKMTTDTQLRIGSTSKALTSAGLARLVAANKLNLDAPLSDYFDTLPHPDWHNMTARQLASHMAGMPHYNENTDILGMLETVGAQTHYPNVLDAMALFDESDLLYAPGEKFSYASLGTVLLSVLIQIKAEQPYQDFIKQAVLAPLNMSATNTGSPDDVGGQTATSYWQDGQQPTRLKPWYKLDLSHRLAAGGWVSTSKNLVQLGQGFLDDNFIPQEVRDTFWTPQQLNNGKTNRQNYGIGWRINDLNLGEAYKPMKYIHHGGETAGAQSYLMVIPEYKLSIAVNTNVKTEAKYAAVAFDIARVFIDELEKLK